MRALITGVLTLPIVVAGCSNLGPEPGKEASWVGTITTEGNVTTVVNESGSVWGGTATLVEEASIGVGTGATEFMFGNVSAVYATTDEIYVLDRSVPEVRAYDSAGRHLRSIGRRGQGPGELSTGASDVAVGPTGRVFVRDAGNGRINIYSAEGEPVDEVPLFDQVAVDRTRMIHADGGGIWMPVRVPGQDETSSRFGFRIHTVDGPVGEPVLVPEIEYDRRVVRLPNGGEAELVPFAAAFTWTMAYDGSVVAGATDRYELQIIRPSGGTLVIERSGGLVPVEPDEADYWTRVVRAQLGRGQGLSWIGENIPDHKPAFSWILPAPSGELWLLRAGPADPGACPLPPEELAVTPDPMAWTSCLFGKLIVDVFGPDGRYLGNVDGFPPLAQTPFVAGDTVVAATQDEVGTIMVKRYRLVPPDAQ